MKIYFAVTDKMMNDQAAAVLSSGHENYNWILSRGGSKYGETFLAGYIASNAGDVLNTIKELKIDFPYTICQAECDDKIILRGFCNAMVGDTNRSVQVIITEFTRIQ